jgi:hypothetical protein
LALVQNGRVFTPLGGWLLLLSRFAVIPAVIARIAPVRSDPDTGSLALVTYRTILFHMLGLLLLIHVDRLSFSYKKCSWVLLTSPGRISLSSSGLLHFRNGIFLLFLRFFTCHRTSFGNVIPFPPAQGPAAEVPAGGRTVIIDGTAPLPGPAAVRLLFIQMPAGCIGKEKAVRFLQAPFAEVMQLVGFAIPDEDNGEPAAALTTAAAGAGYGGRLGGFHGSSPFSMIPENSEEGSD